MDDVMLKIDSRQIFLTNYISYLDKKLQSKILLVLDQVLTSVFSRWLF